MDKVAIVVLNYLNYQDTIECVESIAYDKYSEKQIIIVDNGSSNESKAKLEEKFFNRDGIYLLFNAKNEGFARGNNIGIRYATEQLECRFVLLVNNHTIFKDPQTITVLMEAYEEGVGIIGPRIVGTDGGEQNPVRNEVIRSNLAQEFYYRQKDLNIRLKQSSLYQALRKVNLFKKKKGPRLAVQNSRTSMNLVLHGACMMLTKDYFKYYPYLFPNTFMYYEENILTILTCKVGLSKKFINTTYIYHKEDQSVVMSFNNDSAIKNTFLLESIKSAKKMYPLPYEELKTIYFTLNQ